MNWFSLDADEVLRQQNSSREGLSDTEARSRLGQYGPNTLPEKSRKPAWLIFLNQFKDFMILILVVAAVVSGFVGDLTDTIIILVIVLLNAVMGFVQEYNAEKAMQALRDMSTAPAAVIRGGQLKTIAADELVPGDLIRLEAGNIVPADIRLIEAVALKVDEAALTGESHAVDKTASALPGQTLMPADQLNMAFRGTTVTYGRGSGVVVATGAETQVGNIAHLLQEPELLTPLQRRMTDFGKKLSAIIILLCGLFFLAGYLRGEDPAQMLLVSISLAVAAIPEALPALIAVALSIGARRMVKKNALVRRLPAVETLGSVTYICTDKTGTLTQNKMQVGQVRDVSPPPEEPGALPPLAVYMLLNNDATLNSNGGLSGDPTETAMLQYVMDQSGAAPLNTLRQSMPRRFEIPFDSNRKCMTTIHENGREHLQITKGAAEVLAEMVEAPEREILLQEAEAWSGEGMRVIAFGTRVWKEIPAEVNHEFIEKDLRYGGLVGVLDPPRPEVYAAIEECIAAGIQPVMITGDHPSTARSIAAGVGILKPNHLMLTGRELMGLDEDALAEKAEKIRVYARVSPEQKLVIVKALQKKNHFVAMTGDGVNDAPSLKRADIGIAMGITGTQVSREAADMILLDDNFATIVHAVEEGRRIFDNIRRFTKYILTCNSAELWTLFLAPFIGLPLPLLPIHILFINLVTDGLPGIALGYEKAEAGIMSRPPRRPSESLFAKGLGWHVIWVGVLMAAITLSVQAYSIGQEKEHWQTMVFTVLCLSQMGHVLAIRSENQFLFRHGVFSNPRLIIAVLLTFLVQLAVIYLPVANVIFKTQPLSLTELLICIGLSAIVFHAVELEKWLKKGLNS